VVAGPTPIAGLVSAWRSIRRAITRSQVSATGGVVRGLTRVILARGLACGATKIRQQRQKGLRDGALVDEMVEMAAGQMSHGPTQGPGVICRERIRLAELQEAARRIWPRLDDGERLGPEVSAARLDLGQQLMPKFGTGDERRQVLIGPFRVAMSSLQS